MVSLCGLEGLWFMVYALILNAPCMKKTIPKGRITSYSILGTIKGPNKILL